MLYEMIYLMILDIIYELTRQRQTFGVGGGDMSLLYTLIPATLVGEHLVAMCYDPGLD